MTMTRRKMVSEGTLAVASIQAVVFDLGGVLTTGLREAMGGLLAACGADDERQRERLLSLWGSLYIEASLGRLHPDELWARLTRCADFGLWPVGREETEFLSRIHLREPTIPQTLADLKERYVLGLLSNHVSRWARALLQRLELTPFFEAVVISSEIGARKPDAVTYLRTCELLHVSPHCAVYIADEEEDLVGCEAAGMFPIFIAGEDRHSRVGLPIKTVSDLLIWL